MPFINSAPWLFADGRRCANTSLVDLFPTVIDLADPTHGLAAVESAYDGRSLLGQLQGEDAGAPDRIYGEITSEGVTAPAVMVMEGPYKYIHCDGDPPLLFVRARDPTESENLAGRPERADIEAKLAAAVSETWDLPALKKAVLQCQTRRRVIDRAHAQGQSPDWGYPPQAAGGARFFRVCAENPSASNYNSNFEVRARPDSERPNKHLFP